MQGSQTGTLRIKTQEHEEDPIRKYLARFLKERIQFYKSLRSLIFRD